MQLRHAIALGAAAAMGTAALTACGNDATTTPAPTGSATTGRVIEVSMTDMAYSPNSIDVVEGETVTLRFRNDGRAVHEAVVGDADYQAEHGTSMPGPSMPAMPAGGHGTGDDNMVVVQPGETGELTYAFGNAGSVLIGCHQPGHYEAGMKAKVNVG